MEPIKQVDANESDLVKGASIFFGPDFIEIHSESGGKTGMIDREAFSASLLPDTPDQAIVHHLQQALNASHSCWPHKFQATGGWRGMSERWKAWLNDLYRRHPSKKTKLTLFKGVCWLQVKQRYDTLTFIPKARFRGDEYGFISDGDETLKLTFNVKDPDFLWEIALRQAMALCKG